MRYDLSDFEWSVIQPLLPNKPRGVKGEGVRPILQYLTVFPAI
jgi:transposase